MHVKPAVPRLRRERSPLIYGAWPLADRGNPTRDHVAGNALNLLGTAAWTTGPDGPAISLPGTAGNYLQSIGPTFNPSTIGDFSVVVWFNPNAIATQSLVSQQSGSGTGTTWLNLANGGQLWSSMSAGSATKTSLVATPGAWNLAVLTVQGGVVALYLNGAAGGSGTPTIPSNTGGLIQVGVSANPIAGFFAGSIGRAGLMVWLRALQAGEVLSLYTDPYRLWRTSRRWAALSVQTATGGSGGKVRIGSRLIRCA